MLENEYCLFFPIPLTICNKNVNTLKEIKFITINILYFIENIFTATANNIVDIISSTNIINIPFVIILFFSSSLFLASIKNLNIPASIFSKINGIKKVKYVCIKSIYP